MRFVIVGPGALGSLLAARLCLVSLEQKRAGNDHHQIVLFDYKPDRAEALNKSGLHLEEKGHIYHSHPLVTADPGIINSADILFFCVKATAVANALSLIEPYLSSATLLLAMQNGIGHIDMVTSVNCLVGVGVTSEGATLNSPGDVRHGGKGITWLGLLSIGGQRASQLLKDTAVILNAAGFTTRVSSDPMKYIWAKLFVNVGINALSAIHRCLNGKLLEQLSIKLVMEKAVQEAELIARAKGIYIEEDPVQETFRVCRMTENNVSSMHQDILLHRPTEINSINGAIVTEGERLGIATPVNAELVRQIKLIEASYGSGEGRD